MAPDVFVCKEIGALYADTYVGVGGADFHKGEVPVLFDVFFQRRHARSRVLNIVLGEVFRVVKQL